ncbi:MAG: branched-chain amino acid aminotransferase [Saprospiraceae bacterium]|jgi:branched-chain amino acid aminotransferase|nr:branched-chain amino acid aminotransferase [Saprospiraceae bacterium]
MKYPIRVTKTTASRLDTVDFSNIPFGRVFSDHMFTADYKDGEWSNFQILPFAPFMIHPACMGLHYGQSIFEGMKASRTEDGTPFLFRPEKHAKRLNISAARMCMPDFPEDLFLYAIQKLVQLDQEWIPKDEGSALYIRPLMFANGEFFGVRPSDTYKMIIFTGPVGPYYPKPVSLIAEEKYVRAAMGGAGEAKAAGNYGAALLPAKLAQEQGYDQVLWLDAKEFKFTQEVGTMNIFFVIDGKIMTPATLGTILKGITRESILEMLRDKGYEIEERRISIDEIVDAYKAGKLEEAFGSGTAAVVSHVDKIKYGDLVMQLPALEDRHIGEMIKTEINGMRSGRLPDKYNWLVPIREEALV